MKYYIVKWQFVPGIRELIQTNDHGDTLKIWEYSPGRPWHLVPWHGINKYSDHFRNIKKSRKCLNPSTGCFEITKERAFLELL